ncbi:MAG TPA: phosphomannomutase/phosphoglucomutase [Dissulfurispiraceae bacterium]|nr:phosphomannomutase/phosphoglucomutase [Dissulfurispiraceae bacterium]
MIPSAIFRDYDIRGVAGKDLTLDTAVLIGKSFGSLVKSFIPGAKQVSVGRDVRLSSDELAAGLIKGIVSSGIDVYDLGVCPTPVQYFSLHHLDLDGGIMITGSHNPPEYNGFKISIGKDTLYGGNIQKLREIIERQEWAVSGKDGEIKRCNIMDPYKEYMMKQFGYLNNARFRRIKVVIDAGNGTAGAVVPEILNGIGCEVISLYCEPDGRFPNHHPDPTVVEYMQDLIAETKRSGADIGVGYDGDADRIGIVDSDGTVIWGDQVMIILSRELLKEKPGAMVIGDVKCSQAMFDDVEKHGGIPLMWKTGHSLIKQKMKEEGALIAGEFSGHIFIAHNYFGYDDALYTTFRIIEIMKKTRKDIKELLFDVARMSYTPEIRCECPEDMKKEVVARVVSRLLAYTKDGNAPYRIINVNTLDGIRVLFEKGWGLIRTSNTQPVIVMRAEAEDEEHLHQYTSFLESELKKAMVQKPGQG